MNSILSFIDSFVNVSDFLNICWALLGLVTGTALRWIIQKIKYLKLNYILFLKRKETDVILSSQHGLVVDEDAYQVTSLPYDLVTRNELLAYTELLEVLKIANYRQPLTINLSSDYSGQNTHNTFILGGPLSNEYALKLLTNDVLHEDTRIFRSTLRIGCRKDYFIKRDATTKSILVVTEDENADRFPLYLYTNKEDSTGKVQKITDNSDYVLLMRLVPDFYGNPEHGTTHIMFGNTAAATTQGVSMIKNNTSALYRILKKHNKKCYCVVFRCLVNENDIDFRPNSILDISDTMFA